MLFRSASLRLVIICLFLSKFSLFWEEKYFILFCSIRFKIYVPLKLNSKHFFGIVLPYPTNKKKIADTDYRTSGKIPRKSRCFPFLNIRQENSSNSTNFISSILGGFLVDSHFREHGK